MMLQTRPVSHMLAGAQRKKPAQQTQTFMHSPRIRIRTKIACTVLKYPARNEGPRIFLLQRHLDIWIAFIILQTDIITRPMLLDEIALQNECFDL